MKIIILSLLSVTLLPAQLNIPRHLTADYPGAINPQTALYFMSSTNVALPLSNWTILGCVTNVQPIGNSISITLDGATKFFIVGASNEYTMGVDFWITNNTFSEVLTSAPPVSGRIRIER